MKCKSTLFWVAVLAAGHCHLVLLFTLHFYIMIKDVTELLVVCLFKIKLHIQITNISFIMHIFYLFISHKTLDFFVICTALTSNEHMDTAKICLTHVLKDAMRRYITQVLFHPVFFFGYCNMFSLCCVDGCFFTYICWRKKLLCPHFKSDFNINMCDVNTLTGRILWRHSLEVNHSQILVLTQVWFGILKTPVHSLRMSFLIKYETSSV